MEFQTLPFEEVGVCILDDGLKGGVRFRLDRAGRDRAIYAFLVDDRVKYVGVCEKRNTCLFDRMRRYQGRMGGSPGRESTNMRVADLIRGCLSRGEHVKIYAWKPDAELEQIGLKVDLVKGLENPLIQEFDPEWNKSK